MSTEMKKWNRLDFIEYLKETLIPDLIDSGRFATAEDFETAVFFMDTIPTPIGTVIQRHERVYKRYEE